MSDDDSGEDFNALIDTFLLPADGVYSLLIGHAGGNSEGEFTVDIELEEMLTPTPTATP